MNANLEWFRTFKAIYESGTLSGAAKQLFVSQPGVGIHLNSLETYTGYPLFERKARKMVPTERGHLLYQQMQHSLNVLEEIQGRFRRKAGSDRPTVSVGMCVETFQQALEQHIPYIDFNLIMQFGENEKLTELLENGGADLILTTKPKEDNILEFEAFTTETLMVVCGKNTDLSGWETIDPNDSESLKNWFQQQIWYNTASDMKLLNQFWQENFGIMPEFVPNYIVPNKFSIIRCLSVGQGLAVLPDFICREAFAKSEVKVLWRGYNDVQNTMYFGQRKNSLYSDQIRFLKEKLNAEYADMQEPILSSYTV
ncbi:MULTISPECIES: LysR family transcriptional regulator [Sphingobacterium]|uniref:DNA-binding transcriptional LysR family regulator n=1 Tax=Sphingobacterium siyangense TaxID=459529 RepID=A0A562MC66_9SPHI|nr:LysR family transcriptional regulator [Sphingobacterium siyangense]TWI17408.1 DNA-binding transcriptional LysR family regulator [Sphingobacterium siyangense]